MAYTFLLENDNCLVATRREVIMQRSKLVDEINFLVAPEYKTAENNMSLFNVVMEYILPVSREYHTLELVQDAEGYEEYLKYIVPLDTNFSSEAGDIELQLTFVYVGLDADGKGVQKVRKTKVGKLHITPVAAWSDIIPDSALSALDQRIIMTQAQIQELGYYASVLNENQVDNLKFDDEEETIQLMAGDKGVGDKIKVREVLDEGIPVVEFENESGSGSGSGSNNNNDHHDGCDCGCEDNVVEFGDEEGTDKPAVDDDNVVEF